MKIWILTIIIFQSLSIIFIKTLFDIDNISIKLYNNIVILRAVVAE